MRRRDTIHRNSFWYDCVVTFYSIADGESSTAKVIPVNRELYGKGVYDAAKKFVIHHTDEFLKEL